jgi:exopolysaccharide production protein ExoQ
VESAVAEIEGSPLDALIFAGLFAAGVLVLFTRGQPVRAFWRSNGPLLVFFAYCAVSVLWSGYPFVALKRWTKYAGDLIMVLIVLTDPKPTAAVKWLLTRPGFVLIPISILLIRYYPDLGRQYSAWTGEAYNIGVGTQKNDLGRICLIFGLGSLWYLFEGFRARERGRRAGSMIAHGAVFALALWLFRMADSATSFGCFLVGGSLMAVTRLRAVARKPAVVSFLVVAVLLVGVYGLILNPAAGLTEAAGRSSTLSGRTELWGLFLQLQVNPWFGAGYESFWFQPAVKEIWKTWERANQAHNGYLEVYLDLGWVGVALLGLLIAWGHRNVVRELPRNPETSSLKLAFFVVALLYNLTENAFRAVHPVWIMFLLAITVVPEPGPEDRQGPS